MAEVIELAAELRARCAVGIEAPASHVLINLSHTHSAPMLDDWIPYDTPEQLEMMGHYRRRLLDAVERVCREAKKRLQPARVAVSQAGLL